jgi:hypothetical protein
MYKSKDILVGAIDLHVHASPDTIQRPLREYEVAEVASKAGMRGVLLKNANTNTSYNAFFIEKMVSNFEVFGGICLNHPLGGLNASAIDSAVRINELKPYLKVVWMPTIDAENDGIYRQTPKKGISILDDGELSIRTREVLQKIRDFDLVLGSGHISLNETKILVEEATKMGIRKILVNHVDSPLFEMNIEDQKELRDMGAYLEHTLAVCMPSYIPKPVSPNEVAMAIKKVGASSCIMSTDFIDMYQPNPAEGIRMFVHLMMKNGISREDVDKMVKSNPATLLGLEPF